MSYTLRARAVRLGTADSAGQGAVALILGVGILATGMFLYHERQVERREQRRQWKKAKS